MEIKKVIGVSFILFLIGCGVGHFSKPTKVEVKTVEVVKTQVKYVKSKTKIKYKYKIIKPDGTVIESETYQEGTYTDVNSNTSTSKTEESKTVNTSGVTIQAMAVSQFKTFGAPEYGVYASKRVFGNIIGGVGVTTGNALVTIGFEF